MEKRVKRTEKRSKNVVLRSTVPFILILQLLLTNLFPGLGIMLADTVKMGLDYIELSPNPCAPSEKEVAALMSEKADSNVFVLATDEDFRRLKANYTARDDEKLNEYFDYVAKCADELLDTEPLGYILEEEENSLLETAREILERTVILGFMWRVTGNEAYARRCIKELKNACEFPDWCESHYLDTAEMTFAVSLGANWLYDCLEPEDTELFARSVMEKAFDTSKGKLLSQNWWKWSKTNWNSVCYGGLGVGAMVFYDYCEDFAKEFLAEAYKKMHYNFETFTPDGVFAEGSGYWEYCTTYLTYFMSTSANRMGTDFGLSETDGFMQLGTFPLYITGSVSVFHYGDNKRVSVGAPSLYWFSRRTGDPATAYYQAMSTVESELANGKGKLELCKECAVGALWYDSKLLAGFDTSAQPLAAHLKSDASQEIVVLRSGTFDKSAVYAAIKGGYNYTNHGDLDIGTFVFDCMGERWAEELGPADYGNSGYFVGIIGGGRWKVYAKRAEGQNTLVFNPNKTFEDQYPFAKAGFTKFVEDEQNGGKAVLDMSGAYRFAGVRHVTREFELSDSRNVLTVRDEFICRQPSEVYWFMHTRAEIEIMDSHRAVLKIGGKTMLASLSEDSVGEFRIMPAESLVEGVDNRLKGDSAQIKKLAVYASGAVSGNIEVTLSPVQ